MSVSTVEPQKVLARTPPPAFLFPDQRFQRPRPVKPAKPFNARSRRRRLSREANPLCQAVLLKRRTRRFPRRPEALGRRLSREWPDASQRLFSPTCHHLPGTGRRQSRLHLCRDQLSVVGTKRVMTGRDAPGPFINQLRLEQQPSHTEPLVEVADLEVVGRLDAVGLERRQDHHPVAVRGHQLGTRCRS